MRKLYPKNPLCWSSKIARLRYVIDEKRWSKRRRALQLIDKTRYTNTEGNITNI